MGLGAGRVLFEIQGSWDDVRTLQDGAPGSRMQLCRFVEPKDVSCRSVSDLGDLKSGGCRSLTWVHAAVLVLLEILGRPSPSP